MDCLKWKINAWIFVALMMILFAPFSCGITDSRDVSAINSLYVALGNPPLLGWIPNGGDPCLEAWQGVQCVITNITHIILNGVNLGGVMSENLDLFSSLIRLDLSDNHIGGSIPVNLPLTMSNFSLSSNQLTGSIPDSLSSLSQLIDMDLSANNLSGQLPPSLENLSSLITLHLQDNQLSGTLDVLQDLPLQDLNVENNMFSGPIPEKLLSIPDFKKDGNPFNTTIIPFAPPPGQPISLPPLSGPPVLTPGENNGPSVVEGPSPGETEKFWNSKTFRVAIAVALAFIVIGLLLVVILKSCKKKQHVGIFSRRPKTGVPEGHMEQSNDIESFLQSNNLTEKVSKVAVVRTKDEHGMASPRRVATLNGKPKEKANMKTVGAIQKQDEEHGKYLTGMDMNLLPPPLAPVENFNRIPVVPTVTSGKPPIKSLNRPASLRTFTVASLQQYTNSFSEDNLIGGGTLGRVYRAELPDGKLLAVKKLDNMTSALQNDEEFLDLVADISKLQNANVVKLEGYCLEHGQRLLIYEYCSNETLHDALHSDGLTKKLSWNARIRIALGAARALEYLHEICHPPIVHRNFKSANVLLDNELAVHVSDCGLAPLISAGSQLSGQLLLSNGYGAPEFEMGTYSCQSDVYSFGVVMLELLTGRKSYDRPRGEQYLVRWAIPQLHDIEALSRMVDPSLGAYPAKSLSRFADIISMSVQSEPEFRPPMSEVVQNLLHMIQREPPFGR
ncbi:hypothetical protein AQUCO_06500043v1 [Aquilegia coerulea]|uniref:Protein kinase domain-containing protein n=1 Tax=Aquilegia coerulea TaxID=218851 RepID=A0A2G5CCB7_AQUCA|nr:hypothetical protein AQUCO_06500043v1 [Aquilegia coerulea]